MENDQVKNQRTIEISIDQEDMADYRRRKPSGAIKFNKKIILGTFLVIFILCVYTLNYRPRARQSAADKLHDQWLKKIKGSEQSYDNKAATQVESMSDQTRVSRLIPVIQGETDEMPQRYIPDMEVEMAPAEARISMRLPDPQTYTNKPDVDQETNVVENYDDEKDLHDSDNKSNEYDEDEGDGDKDLNDINRAFLAPEVNPIKQLEAGQLKQPEHLLENERTEQSGVQNEIEQTLVKQAQQTIEQKTEIDTDQNLESETYNQEAGDADTINNDVPTHVEQINQDRNENIDSTTDRNPIKLTLRPDNIMENNVLPHNNEQENTVQKPFQRMEDEKSKMVDSGMNREPYVNAQAEVLGGANGQIPLYQNQNNNAGISNIHLPEDGEQNSEVKVNLEQNPLYQGQNVNTETDNLRPQADDVQNKVGQLNQEDIPAYPSQNDDVGIRNLQPPSYSEQNNVGQANQENIPPYQRENNNLETNNLQLQIHGEKNNFGQPNQEQIKLNQGQNVYLETDNLRPQADDLQNRVGQLNQENIPAYPSQNDNVGIRNLQPPSYSEQNNVGQATQENIPPYQRENNNLETNNLQLQIHGEQNNFGQPNQEQIKLNQGQNVYLQTDNLRPQADDLQNRVGQLNQENIPAYPSQNDNVGIRNLQPPLYSEQNDVGQPNQENIPPYQRENKNLETNNLQLQIHGEQNNFGQPNQEQIKLYQGQNINLETDNLRPQADGVQNRDGQLNQENIPAYPSQNNNVEIKNLQPPSYSEQNNIGQPNQEIPPYQIHVENSNLETNNVQLPIQGEQNNLVQSNQVPSYQNQNDNVEINNIQSPNDGVQNNLVQSIQEHISQNKDVIETLQAINGEQNHVVHSNQLQSNQELIPVYQSQNNGVGNNFQPIVDEQNHVVQLNQEKTFTLPALVESRMKIHREMKVINDVNDGSAGSDDANKKGWQWKENENDKHVYDENDKDEKFANLVMQVNKHIESVTPAKLVKEPYQLRFEYPSYLKPVDWKSAFENVNAPTFECVPMRTLQFYIQVCIHPPNVKSEVSSALKEKASWEYNALRDMQIALSGHKESILVDIGASIGVFSLAAAAMNRNVISIEPYPSHIQVFKQSVLLNRLEDRITLFQTVVSDRRGKVLIKRLGDHVDNFYIQTVEDNEPLTSSSVVVNSVTLGDIEVVCPTRIAVLKIDAPGFTKRVLENSQYFFKYVYVTHVFMHWDTSDRDLCHFLVKFFVEEGYRPFSDLRDQTSALPIEEAEYWTNDIVIWKL